MCSVSGFVCGQVLLSTPFPKPTPPSPIILRPTSGHPWTKCSKSGDWTAIPICDSKRKSQITGDLRKCVPSEKTSMYWLVVQEIGVEFKGDLNRGSNHIWTEVLITNRAMWLCDLSCQRQRFPIGLCDFKSPAIYDLRFGAHSPWQDHGSQERAWVPNSAGLRWGFPPPGSIPCP